MRTTISIEDSLLQKAKKISHERRCSLREVIEDALRAAFAKGHKANRSRAHRPLKTFKGSGVQLGIDLSSSSALLDAMESR
jgi:Arc/MetJ family transcription regulator